MSRTTIVQWKSLLRLAITLMVVAFWAVYLRGNWDSFVSFRWQVDFGWMILASVAGIGFWLTIALIWQRVLIIVGGSLGMSSAIRIWATSMLGRYVPGSVWHIAARVYLAERAGQSGVAVFISTILEQVLAILACLLVLLVGLPFWDADYARLAPVLILALPLAVVVHPAVLRRFTSLAARFAGRRGPPIAPASGVSASGDPSAAIPLSYGSLPAVGYRSLIALLVAYTLPNLLATVVLYFSLAAVGPVSPGQLPLVAGAWSMGWIVGFFSFFAPGGLGVREGATALLLTPVFGAPAAVAASVLSRVAISVGEAVVLGASWLWKDKEEREKREKGEERIGLSAPK